MLFAVNRDLRYLSDGPSESKLLNPFASRLPAPSTKSKNELDSPIVEVLMRLTYVLEKGVLVLVLRTGVVLSR